MDGSINLMPERHGRLCFVRGDTNYTSRVLQETLDAAAHSRLWSRRPVLFVSHPDVAKRDYGEHDSFVTDSPEEIYHQMSEQTGIVVIDGAARFAPTNDQGEGLSALIDSLVRSNRLVIAADKGVIDDKINGNIAELLAISDKIIIKNGLVEEAWRSAFVGGMFSGKSRNWGYNLAKTLKKTVSQNDVLVFKYLGDVRYGEKKQELFDLGNVTLHNGVKIPGVLIRTIGDSIDYMAREGLNPKFIFYDEGQFLPDLMDALKFKDMGIKIGVNGLIRGFNRGKFGPMSEYLAFADKINYKDAVCTTCGSPARENQRMKYLDNHSDRVIAAHADDPLEAIGGAKGATRDPFYYEARCLDHWLLRGTSNDVYSFTRYTP